MAEKLLDVANLVTGFAVAQSIGTTFAIAKDDLKESLKGIAAHTVAIAATVMFSGFYIYAVGWCCAEGREIDAASNVVIWNATNTGRIVAIMLFGLVTIGALFGRWVKEAKGLTPLQFVAEPPTAEEFDSR